MVAGIALGLVFGLVVACKLGLFTPAVQSPPVYANPDFPAEAVFDVDWAPVPTSSRPRKGKRPGQLSQYSVSIDSF